MISVAEASKIFREKMPNWGTIEGSLYDVKAEYSSTPILSDRNYPSFNRVMMDGIAVNFKSLEKGITSFLIQDTIPAGTPQRKLSDLNNCYEIMTGAVLPEGADVVIPYEQIRINGNTAKITDSRSRLRWENVHLEGSDCHKNDVVLNSNLVMNGPHWGIAASMGVTKLSMKRKPRVLVVSTGDELVDINKIPENYQIRRSNVYALKASLFSFGYYEVDLDHIKDNPKVVAEHFTHNTKKYDMMIYSGGVSKGKFDYLPNIWSDLKVEKYLHTIAQRPGKPLWFGVDQQNKTAVIGLPGNPVSSLVCLHRYLLQSKLVYARLANDLSHKHDITLFAPAKLEYREDGTLWALLSKVKNSGEFTALAETDGFLELPQGQSEFKTGEAYPFWGWRP